MIDTIHFKIHNLAKNVLIKHQFETNDKKGNTLAEVERSTLETLEGNKVRVILFHDRDNIIPIVRRSSLIIPSSHYSISYLVNQERDFIEFNVSIPKYQWGTNILQYIPYYSQTDRDIFHLVQTFFTGFFKRLFRTDPDFTDIEISRIDLCYNQFFATKQDALTYLGYQKELAMKFARSSSNNYRTHQSSIFYHTKRYSFKIYHKGTEFDVHDKKELAKNNPLNHNIPELQHEADRILRYELTVRKSYLDYILKNDIVFKDDVQNKYTSVFNRMTRYDNRTAAKVIDNFKNKSLNYHMSSLWDRPQPDLNAYIDNYKVTFDFELFSHLFKRFWQRVSDYQVNVAMSPHDILKKIEQHNKNTAVRNSLRKKQETKKDNIRMLVPAMLAQHVPVETLKDYLPERAFYRLKADLKAMGIDTYNSNYTVPSPKLDYQEYRYIFGRRFNLTIK